jgi:hypothetical protein
VRKFYGLSSSVGSATLPMRGDYEGVSGTRLSCLPLLFPIGWRGGKLSGARGSGSRGFGLAGGPPCLHLVATATTTEEVGGGGKLELMCSRAAYAEKPSPVGSVLAN